MMAWTYDASLPSAKDRVRLALGDTNTANQLRSDETINALITAYGEAAAAAQLADGLAAQFAQKPDSIGMDGLTISWRERVRTWRELGSRLHGQIVAVAASIAATRGETADAEYRRSEWWTPTL